jgi:SNF2 family DNA or RNA helicase
VKRCHTHVGAPDNRIKAFLKKEHVLTPRGKDMIPELGPVVTVSPGSKLSYLYAWSNMFLSWLGKEEGGRPGWMLPVSSAKAGHVCDFVNLILDSGEPCLLFAYHHSVIDIYLRLLAKHNPVCVTGRESKEEKSEAIKLFMAGATDLIIVNIRTTAGLNLQWARCVVLGELDWSPAVHKQAEDRIHRIGQKDSVLSYYMGCPGSF